MALSALRIAELSLIAVGIIGICIGFLKSREAFKDMEGAELAGVNGFFRLHALVAIRNGAAISLTHFILGGLGVFALLNSPPPQSQYFRDMIFWETMAALQAVLAGVQAWNYKDILKLHRQANLDSSNISSAP